MSREPASAGGGLPAELLGLPVAVARLRVAGSPAAGVARGRSRGWRPVSHPGSRLRGAIGEHGRRLVCVRPERVDCPGCDVQATCTNARLFAPLPGILGGRTRPPMPWRLALRRGSGHLEAHLHAFGRDAGELLGHLLAALRRAGEEGGLAGLSPGRIVSEEVGPVRPLGDWMGAVLHPPVPCPVEVHLSSPLILRRGGRPLRRVADLGTLVGAAARRARLGWEAWASARTRGDAWYPPLSTRPPARSRLRWVEEERGSRRQGRVLPLHGLRGRLEFAEVEPLDRAWLAVAGVLGIGRGVTVGAGSLSVRLLA